MDLVQLTMITLVMLQDIKVILCQSQPTEITTTLTLEKAMFAEVQRKRKAEEIENRLKALVSTTEQMPGLTGVLDKEGKFVFVKSSNRYLEVDPSYNNTNEPSLERILHHDFVWEENMKKYLKVYKNESSSDETNDEKSSDIKDVQLYKESKTDSNLSEDRETSHPQCSHSYCFTVVLIVSSVYYHHSVSKF